jgi:pimeloyl-ACP methyl ester carboxylesterase
VELITVEGVSLQVACCAGADDRLPILLLHEGLGSVETWRDFPGKLAAVTGHRVIAYSRRGYGLSAPFDGAYDLGFMHREADAAAALMADMGIERAHVFGHSDGASIALLLAARYPACAASLILEAPHIFVEAMCVAAIKGLEDSSEQLVSRLGKYHRDAASVFSQWFNIWTDPCFPEWTIETEIDAIACPTFVIQGENDEYGTFEQVDRICARMPQTQQLRLPACGHSPHRDCEEAVLGATTAFYGEVSDG